MRKNFDAGFSDRRQSLGANFAISHLEIAKFTPQKSSTELPQIARLNTKFDFRLRYLEKNGTYYKATTTLTNGISKNISWWSPDVLINYNGPLWETFPVEVSSRSKPAKTTLHTLEVPAIEQALFNDAGLSVADFKKFLTRNKLALVVTRNVTSRDDKDQQQPYNLKVTNSTTQTVHPTISDNIYEVKYLQYLQGDQIRGIGAREGLNDTDIASGRRTLAQYMHDTTALLYNLPTTGKEGSITIATDGSVAAVVPANRAMTWQLTDADNQPIVRERVWLSFQAGEIRVCTSCHGENDRNQAGLVAPTNAPMALRQLLNQVKHMDTDMDNTIDLYDAYPRDNNKHLAEALNEDFVHQLSNWINTNIDADATKWETTTTACNEQSISINNQLATTKRQIDQISQYIDLRTFGEAALTFDLAYAQASNADNIDELKVRVIECTSADEFTIYQKSGSELATTSSQSAVFVPTDCNQWRTEIIDLSNFAGQEIKLIFENIGGKGNQLFLDNIIIKEETPILTTSIVNPIEPIQLQVYPNPLSSYTNINYYLPNSGPVSLQVLDIMGNTIKNLRNESDQSAGFHKAVLSTADLTNGTYFILLRYGEQIYTKRLFLIK